MLGGTEGAAPERAVIGDEKVPVLAGAAAESRGRGGTDAGAALAGGGGAERTGGVAERSGGGGGGRVPGKLLGVGRGGVEWGRGGGGGRDSGGRAVGAAPVVEAAGRMLEGGGRGGAGGVRGGAGSVGSSISSVISHSESRGGGAISVSESRTVRPESSPFIRSSSRVRGYTNIADDACARATEGA